MLWMQRLLVLGAFGLVACEAVEESPLPAPDLPIASLVIRDVTVVDMMSGQLVPDQSIAVSADSILAIGPDIDALVDAMESGFKKIASMP